MDKKCAFVFPGQGSQYVGMGKGFLASIDEAGQVFSAAEEITGKPIQEFCLAGPLAELTRTSVLQPALCAVEMVCVLALRQAGFEPAAVAGHSLGEYAALWAAGVVSLEDTLLLVHERGKIMEAAGEKARGAMAAVIGLSQAELEGIVNAFKKEGVIALANHNSAEQIVITGEEELVAQVAKKAKEKGARAVPLKVKGAFHSPLMQEAAVEFARFLDQVPFQDGNIPLYSNVTARGETKGEKIKENLKQQMCSPVRWFETVNNIYQDGIRCFLEAGPKKVLSNLIKKSLPGDDFRVFQVEDPETLKTVLT